MTSRVLLLAAATLALPVDSLVAQRQPRGPAVLRLGFLVGTFEGESRFTPPGGTARTGRMSFRAEWDLDSAIVKANYEQQLGNSPTVSGHLIFRWRPRDSTYAFEGYANALMDPHRLTGRWEGRLIFEGTMGGAAFRELWEPRGADTLVSAMELKQGEAWIPVTVSVLVRKRP